MINLLKMRHEQRRCWKQVRHSVARACTGKSVVAEDGREYLKGICERCFHFVERQIYRKNSAQELKGHINPSSTVRTLRHERLTSNAEAIK